MGYFKIKNITNLLPKRHISKNSLLEIDYSSGYKKEAFKLNVGAEAYIEAGNLPINIHKLRMKKMISVREISKNDFFKKQRPKVQPISELKTTKKPIPVATTEAVKTTKKRTYKKKTESTVISTPEEK